MHFQDLPASRLVSFAYSEKDIKHALSKIFTGLVTYYDIIEGMPCSGRIFYHQSDEKPKPVSSVRLVADIATELKLYSNEARYCEPRANEHGRKKGWEIRTGFKNGRVVIIAIAAWIEETEPSL